MRFDTPKEINMCGGSRHSMQFYLACCADRAGFYAKHLAQPMPANNYGSAMRILGTTYRAGERFIREMER